MNISELKKLQEEIIAKNRKCNLIVAIVIFPVILITFIMAIASRSLGVNTIVIIGFELVFGLIVIMIVKSIINGKDISKFQKEFKNIFILNGLKKTFDNLVYNIESGFDEEELYNYGMINTSDRFTSNDYISGTYKGIKFEQSDIKIEKEHESEDSNGNKTTTWITIFEGRYMIFDFNKKFLANVEVVSSKFSAIKLPHGKKFSKIKLEDIEFNKLFSVYTDIEHDAFYILTPHFMEKIKKLYKDLGYPVMLGFLDNRLHIALDNREDSFEWNVFEPLDEEKINDNIIKDIKLITDFVNELNLDNDLFRREK